MKKISVSEKTAIVARIKHPDLFYKDLELFKKVKPMSELNIELTRINAYNQDRLHIKMLHEILSACTEDEIILHRDPCTEQIDPTNTNPLIYEGVIDRLNLCIGKTPKEELETLKIVLSESYQDKITEEELVLVKSRFGELCLACNISTLEHNHIDKINASDDVVKGTKIEELETEIEYLKKSVPSKKKEVSKKSSRK